MVNLILADLFKIRKSMAIKIIFAITTGCAVAMVVMAYLVSHGIIDKGMTGIGFMFSDINIMSILGAVVAGVFICGDFDNKTIHDAIAGGYSRGAVIVSKAVTFCCAVVFILFPYMIATGIALSTGFKFGMGSVAVGYLNLLTSQAGKVFTASDIMKLLAVILTLLIVYLGQLSICVPLALILKKPVLVVAIYYGLTILCANLAASTAKNSVLDIISRCTPYRGEYTLLTLSTGADVLFRAIVVSLIFIIAMLVITYFAFRKSEIK